MKKYDKAAKKILEEEIFKKEQKRLREKYDENENVIIKEKSHLIKFTIKTLEKIFKVGAGLILISLSATGVISLLYENTRIELFETLGNIFIEIKSMI